MNPIACGCSIPIINNDDEKNVESAMLTYKCVYENITKRTLSCFYGEFREYVQQTPHVQVDGM